MNVSTTGGRSARNSPRLFRDVRYWIRQLIGERLRRTRRDAKKFGVSPLRPDLSSRQYRKRARAYWRQHLDRRINPLWHVAFSRITGIEDVRVVPGHEWWDVILPHFNDLPLRPAFRDKNVSDLFLRCDYIPRTVIKRMHGRYYTGSNEAITEREAEQAIRSSAHEQVIKPSQTDSGRGVSKLVIEDSKVCLRGKPCTLRDLEAGYGPNFIVQERVEQHPAMAQVHPQSANTIRVHTFRWRSDVVVLIALARFGVDGKLTDNAGTGGLCCGIDTEGYLHDAAIDLAGRPHSVHPTTGFEFSQRMQVPGYHDVCRTAIELHRQVFHFDLVSWDFIVGRDAEPIFLEINFRGEAFAYQLAARRPLFGDLTAEVLETIRDSRKSPPLKIGRNPAP